MLLAYDPIRSPLPNAIASLSAYLDCNSRGSPITTQSLIGGAVIQVHCTAGLPPSEGAYLSAKYYTHFLIRFFAYTSS